MFYLCEKCPDIANFRNFFKISFDKNDFDTTYLLTYPD